MIIDVKYLFLDYIINIHQIVIVSVLHGHYETKTLDIEFKVCFIGSSCYSYTIRF